MVLPAGPPTPAETARPLWRAGRLGWSILAVAATVLVAGWVLSAVSLAVVPAVLALFPAAALTPVGDRLKHRGVPPAVAALITVFGAILLIGAVIGAMIPLVLRELPALIASATEGIARLERLLATTAIGNEVGGLVGLLELAREQVGPPEELTARIAGALMVAVETIAALLLVLVVLFFYVKDGPRLSSAILSFVPGPRRERLRRIGERAWETLSGYVRGQLLVALTDALFIGAGLLLLGVPLALPLAVLVFFGGFFPLVGALVTGTLAVLVALADAGLIGGLLVLALVVAVAQLEGNLLEPLILSRVIHLHPLVILLTISGGALLFGILGAFLAVPVAAIVARVRELLDEPVATAARP